MAKFPQQLLDESGCSTPEEFFESKQHEMMDSVQPVYCSTCGHEECMAEPDAEMPCSEPECNGTAHGLENLVLIFLS